MTKPFTLLIAFIGAAPAQGCNDDSDAAPYDGSIGWLDASPGAAEAGPSVSSSTAQGTAFVDAGPVRTHDAASVPSTDASGADAGIHDAGGSSEAGTPEAGVADSDASLSATCPAGATLKPGDSTGSLIIGGVKRSYLLHVPKGYAGTVGVPLVLDFHGLSASGSGEKSVSGYQAVSDKEGFIIAWPDGIDRAWNVGPCCTKERTVDDVGFAKALVAKLKTEGCIDPKRIYSVGFSMGGGMTHQLGCNAADVFAAIAPAAFDLLVEQEQPCRPTRPISVLAFRSSNDGLVTYSGGASTPPTQGYSLPAIHFLGAEASTKRWADFNMCTGTPTDSGGGCKTYAQCAAGVEVTLCTSATAGHAPGDATKGWSMLKRFVLP